MVTVRLLQPQCGRLVINHDNRVATERVVMFAAVLQEYLESQAWFQCAWKGDRWVEGSNVGGRV